MNQTKQRKRCENYLTLPKLLSKLLKSAIATKENNRHDINLVLIDNTDERSRFVATDGYQLVVVEHALAGELTPGLYKLDGQTLVNTKTENWIDRYPNYKKVMQLPDIQKYEIPSNQLLGGFLEACIAFTIRVDIWRFGKTLKVLNDFTPEKIYLFRSINQEVWVIILEMEGVTIDNKEGKITAAFGAYVAPMVKAVL